MADIQGENMLTVLAPAKINLTLEALAKRPDGFHEVHSVIQTIKLYDSFSFKPGKKLVIKCDYTGWLAGESLVSRVAGLLKETSGYTGGATIELLKKIPLLSGLGGDSSDAATVLLGLNRLWGLALAPGELARLASQLGSDVSFFLFGGTALLQGRGEIVSPLPSLPHMWVVLVIPPATRSGGKTGLLYSRLKENHYTNGQKTEKLVSLLTKGGGVAPDNLFNVFESVAYNIFKGLDGYRQKFLRAGAASVHLAGSGPALFTMIKEKAQAEKIYSGLKKQGLEAYLAETLDNI
ncbi:MAG: 4-(cytidine 5'-diphospho)-2-C-methyl-D-erythritol kinase [Chloroflexota bacterium]